MVGLQLTLQDTKRWSLCSEPIDNFLWPPSDTFPLRSQSLSSPPCQVTRPLQPSIVGMEHVKTTAEILTPRCLNPSPMLATEPVSCDNRRMSTKMRRLSPLRSPSWAQTIPGPSGSRQTLLRPPVRHAQPQRSSTVPWPLHPPAQLSIAQLRIPTTCHLSWEAPPAILHRQVDIA
jgi:hypothetical protein